MTIFSKERSKQNEIERNCSREVFMNANSLNRYRGAQPCTYANEREAPVIMPILVSISFSLMPANGMRNSPATARST